MEVKDKETPGSSMIVSCLSALQLNTQGFQRRVHLCNTHNTIREKEML